MASDARMTDDMVNKSLNDITDNYRGFYYTAEEIALISDVPLHRLASLLEANSSWPGWPAIRIHKSDRVKLARGGSTIRYYCPYSSSIPPSMNSMRSAEEREQNSAERPPVEAPSAHRHSKRVKSSAEAASVLETPTYVRDEAGRLSSSSFDVTPVSDLRPSSASSSSSAPRSSDSVPPRTPLKRYR